jgi:hypothetical protein
MEFTSSLDHVEREVQGSKEEPTTMTDPKLAAEPATRRTYRITVDVEATLASGLGEGSAGPSWAEAGRHHGDLVGRLLDRPELLEGLLRSSAIDALGRAWEQLRTDRGWGRTPEQDILEEAMEGMTEDTRAYFEEELEDGASAYLFDGYGADVVRVAISEIRPEPSG